MNAAPPDGGSPFDQLVERWAAAIEADARVMRHLAQRFGLAMTTGGSLTQASRAVGRELVTIAGAASNALKQTMHVLRNFGPPAFGMDSPAGRDRLADGVVELTIGYAEELAGRALDKGPDDNDQPADGTQGSAGPRTGAPENASPASTLPASTAPAGTGPASNRPDGSGPDSHGPHPAGPVTDARPTTSRERPASQDQFRAVFQAAAVGMGVARMDGAVLDVNPAMLRMFGLTSRLSGPPRVTDFVHPGDAETFTGQYRELIRGDRETMVMEIRFVRPDHSVLNANLTATLVRDQEGSPHHMIAVVEDITERYELQSRLADQTYYDQLTRLPNRALTVKRLRELFAPGSPVERVGLAALGLDGFRAINEGLGGEVGDEVLRAVADRLATTSQDYLLARTGADEFAIVITDPTEFDLPKLAKVVLDTFIAPFAIGDHELTIPVSIGLVEMAVRDTCPTELLRAADVAVSWARAEGSGQWVQFDAERDAGEMTRFALMSAMPAAVKRNEFRLEYQPLVTIAEGAMVGVEALVRWHHPEHGLLSPAQFIALAERSGAIVPLGRWVLAKACRQAKRWCEQFGDRAPYVSVNLAPRQVAEPDLVDGVATVLSETGLPAGRLQLEITEQAVLDDQANALPALRALGVRLAIDDFGTGYANFARLRKRPLAHALKIDGSFIKALRAPHGADPADIAIVDSLIKMAHALGLVVIAEWVETADQARQLADLSCDLGQGLYFGDAMPAACIERLLRDTRDTRDTTV